MKKLHSILFFLVSIFSLGQEIVISGIVIDKKTGEPIVGVNVLANKTYNGTTTDFDGKYSLKANINDTLVFGFPGMKIQRVIVDKEGINIELEEGEEIKTEIGPAYYPQRKLNNSVKTISEKEIILNSSYKLIKGFVFENIYLADKPLPAFYAEIKVKGTERISHTDIDGKFEIEVKEGEILVIKGTSQGIKEILVTNNNCYEIYLSNNLTDDYIFTKKETRRRKAEIRKIEKRYQKKLKNGFYDCSE